MTESTRDDLVRSLRCESHGPEVACVECADRISEKTPLEVHDGDWVCPEPQSGFLWGCCDCGLFHSVDFRVIDGRVELRVYRDIQKTEEWRAVTASKSENEKNDLRQRFAAAEARLAQLEQEKQMTECLRCRRPETAKIHDTIGRQGTGTEAVHAFIGDREAAILHYAARELGWIKKSKPHSLHIPPELAIWNDAIAKAKDEVIGFTAPLDPQELARYDKYWGDDVSGVAAPTPTFIIGDTHDDIFNEIEQFGVASVRPIYGPTDANGKRQLVGVIRSNQNRADLVDYLARLTEMLEFADANMPRDKA